MKTINMSNIKRSNVILFIFLMTCSCEIFDLCSGIDCEFKGKISSEDLISVIKYYQEKHVRKSYGTYAYQCFTSDDYTSFCNDKITEKIRSELKRSKLLDKLVNEIGKLGESERTQLLNKGLTTYQPTWSELGRISEEGQTVAGQQAQKEIAATIVNLMKDELGI
jgi:ribosomal protein S18